MAGVQWTSFTLSCHTNFLLLRTTSSTRFHSASHHYMDFSTLNPRFIELACASRDIDRPGGGWLPSSSGLSISEAVILTRPDIRIGADKGKVHRIAKELQRIHNLCAKKIVKCYCQRLQCHMIRVQFAYGIRFAESTRRFAIETGHINSSGRVSALHFNLLCNMKILICQLFSFDQPMKWKPPIVGFYPKRI